MRILSLLWGFSIGGIGKCLLAYQRLAEQTDFDVHTACIQLDCVSCNLESLEDIGATIIRVKNRRDFSWVRKCQKLIDQYQPDMLFVHGFNGPVVAKILQYEHKDRLPFVCSYHGLYHPPKISRLLPAPIFNSSAEYIYKHYAKGIVSVAHYCKKYLVSRGVPETKITVIHNGITKAQQLEKKLTRAEVGLSNEDFVIGATSRLDPVKGLKYLIDAFTRIIKVVPNAKLILVGSGSVEKQLRARCRWLNIKQAVLFPGYQSDVDAWLNLFDLFVLPSLHEYHSIVVIHQDIKQASGVDIVGDLTDQAFLNRLRKKPFKLVLCNNLLEHLPDRMPFLRALRDLIPPGGYLIITTPFEYPKHMDPIDTMYRPSISDLRDLFPEMDLLNSAEIDVGTVWKSLSQDLPKLVKLLVRAAIPFWKYNGWVTSVNKLLWLFKTRKITCVLLRKSNANCNTFT